MRKNKEKIMKMLFIFMVMLTCCFMLAGCSNDDGLINYSTTDKVSGGVNFLDDAASNGTFDSNTSFKMKLASFFIKVYAFISDNLALSLGILAGVIVLIFVIKTFGKYKLNKASTKSGVKAAIKEAQKEMGSSNGGGFNGGGFGGGGFNGPQF